MAQPYLQLMLVKLLDFSSFFFKIRSKAPAFSQLPRTKRWSPPRFLRQRRFPSPNKQDFRRNRSFVPAAVSSKLLGKSRNCYNFRGFRNRTIFAVVSPRWPPRVCENANFCENARKNLTLPTSQRVLQQFLVKPRYYSRKVAKPGLFAETSA